MSDDRLTPELQSLLSAEREAPGPDAGARDRVARRLGQTLGVTLVAAGASTAAASGAQAVLPKALVGKSLAAKLMIAAVVGGVGAGGVAATVTLVHRRAAARAAHASPPRVAPPPAPRSAPAAATPPLPPPSLSAAVEPPPMAAPTATATEPPAAHEPHHAARHADLAAERALLADARAAMQTSDAARALAILDEHARRFPRGQLAEERDALRVAALWLDGDHEAARRRADDFARRHPDSLFLPSVQRTVR